MVVKIIKKPMVLIDQDDLIELGMSKSISLLTQNIVFLQSSFGKPLNFGRIGAVTL